MTTRYHHRGSLLRASRLSPQPSARFRRAWPRPRNSSSESDVTNTSSEMQFEAAPDAHVRNKGDLEQGGLGCPAR